MGGHGGEFGYKNAVMLQALVLTTGTPHVESRLRIHSLQPRLKVIAVLPQVPRIGVIPGDVSFVDLSLEAEVTGSRTSTDHDANGAHTAFDRFHETGPIRQTIRVAEEPQSSPSIW